MTNGLDVRGRAIQDGELAAWLAEHSLGNRFGLAVVGTGTTYGAKAVALAIVAADGEGRYIDVDGLTPDDEAALASWFADPGPPKAIHEAKPAMHALAGRGWTLRGVTSDTALAAHLLQPTKPGAGLNDLLIRHMRCALPASQDNPVQALILRACAVLDLADVLDEELARNGAFALLSRVELPLQRVHADLEITGVAVNRAALVAARGRAHVDELLDAIAADGRIHAASQFDLSSGPIREAFVAGDGFAGLMTARYGEAAVDAVKMAIINLDQSITEAGLTSRLVLLAGNELLFEVANGEPDELESLVREHLGELEVAVGVGPSWAAAALTSL
ncbi:hypothetical protein H7J50_27295 [Mycobacterium intermedium]|nr:hypothetical protein [Mycobacterium intermedium]MCV6967477.1 hypothetical protein [Mycobacterium intermedium]